MIAMDIIDIARRFSAGRQKPKEPILIINGICASSIHERRRPREDNEYLSSSGAQVNLREYKTCIAPRAPIIVKLTPSICNQAGTSWIIRYKGRPDENPTPTQMSMRQFRTCSLNERPECRSVTKIVVLQRHSNARFFQRRHSRLQIVTFLAGYAHFVAIYLALNF